MIGLSTIAQAQQTEGERSEAARSEMIRVTALIKEMNERMSNADVSDPRALMETCQKLLPQLDDAFRTTMTYGNGDATQRSEMQRLYITTRQNLLNDLVLAQRRLATQGVQPAPAPSPVAVATPAPTLAPRNFFDPSIVQSLPGPHKKDVVGDALAYSKKLVPFLRVHPIPGKIKEEQADYLAKLIIVEAKSEGCTDPDEPYAQQYFLEVVAKQLVLAGVIAP
jgi:hypothetical protein